MFSSYYPAPARRSYNDARRAPVPRRAPYPQQHQQQYVDPRPVPRYAPRDAAYYDEPAPVYERAPRYQNQVRDSLMFLAGSLTNYLYSLQYREPSYDDYEPEPYYARRQQPQPQRYEYDDAAYDYDYQYEEPAYAPQRATRPARAAYRGEYEEPAPRRRSQPQPQPQRRPQPQALAYITESDDEEPYSAPPALVRRQQQQQQRPARRVHFNEAPASPRAGGIEDVMGFLQGILGAASAPAPQRRDAPRAPPRRQAPVPTASNPLEAFVQQLIGGGDVEQSRRTQRPAPTPRRAHAAPSTPDVTNVLRQLFGAGAGPQAVAPHPQPQSRPPVHHQDILSQLLGQSQPQTQSAPRPQPPQQPELPFDPSNVQEFLGQLLGGLAPQHGAAAKAEGAPESDLPFDASTMQDFIGQMMGLAMGQQQDESQSQGAGPSGIPASEKPAADVKGKGKAKEEGPSVRSLCSHLSSGVHSDLLLLQKPAYTFALPASAQQNILPRPAGPLPTPGRTFAHLATRPNAGAPTQVQGNAGAGDEVADIREAIRRSLDPKENLAPAPAPAPVAIPVVGRAPSPIPSATSSIDAISARLSSLTTSFAYPAVPDYLHPTTSSALAYTPTNAPIRLYEQALTKCLTDLDAVESGGDEEVRKRRKEVVRAVEGALEELEREKEEKWKALHGSEMKEEGYVIPDVVEPEVASPAPAESEVESTPSETVVPASESSVTPTPKSSSSELTAVPETPSYPPRSPLPATTKPAEVEADDGHSISSLSSSPVEIPSDLDSDSEAEKEAEDLQVKEKTVESDEEGDVPPSMEESVMLEKKTEFVLL